MSATGEHVIADGAVLVEFPGCGYPGDPPLMVSLRITCDEAVEVNASVYARIAVALTDCVRPAPGVKRTAQWRTPEEATSGQEG